MTGNLEAGKDIYLGPVCQTEAESTSEGSKECCFVRRSVGFRDVSTYARETGVIGMNFP